MNDLSTAPLVSGSDFWLMIFKSMGMLCIVLGVMVGILFMIRKFSLAKQGGRDKSMIRLLSAFYLAPKEQVVLLDVMGRKILIGVTSQSITRITEFSGEEFVDEEPLEDRKNEPIFKNLLSRISRETQVSENSNTPMVQKAEA